MSNFVFTSPGVKFKEKDLSFVTRQVGTTFLGLVGETEKGPAFEPIKIEDKTEFRKRLGRQSHHRFPNGDLQYQLPYVANAFLDESNELYVTRVLGLSGYDGGQAWAITLNSGYGPDEDVWAETGNTGGDSDSISGNTYTIDDDVTITVVGNVEDVEIDGSVSKDNGTFTKKTYTYTITDYDPIALTSNITYTWVEKEADELEEYNNMVLAVLRSRGLVFDEFDSVSQTIFDTISVSISGNTTNTIGDLFGNFNIVVTDSEANTEIYNVSLNPNASNYISRVFGVDGKDKKTKIWVESVYPDLLKKLDQDNLGYGINDDLVHCTNSFYNNYTKESYKTPETPWVVSQVRGDSVERLFRFISISDGNAANREIKISILNINPLNGEFDVRIRDFNDTDSNPIVFEAYTRCSLNPREPSFIANRIGTIDGVYSLKSDYVMLEMEKNINSDSFPAGFEGYWFNKYDATPPKILYKRKYEDDENINRVYLGISPLAYSSNAINQNYFNFNGWYDGIIPTYQDFFEKSKGFHLDEDADLSVFDVGFGKLQEPTDVLLDDKPYFEEASRKFTLVPAGGFDGWDIHRNERTHGDDYRSGGIFDGVLDNQTPTNDYQAWETAINTFANPENIYINLFATPGINWAKNTTLVQNTIRMIENERSDSLYVIDSPDENIPQVVGENNTDVLVSKQVSEYLVTTGIDSSYSCTYFPWIQIRDTQNGINVYIPPTGEVVSAMAFTDKIRFPWFAPAGLQRGVTNAKKSKYRLSADARRILYANRINPIADFANTGTAIFGQKTLQIKETALDRINVRRLLLQIKKIISNIAVRLVFEQNDQTLIDEFLSKTTPILDTIKRERGLYDFKIKMDDSINTPETIDRYELYGEIFLKPTKAVEYIGITFNITPTGASFDDL